MPRIGLLAIVTATVACTINRALRWERGASIISTNLEMGKGVRCTQDFVPAHAGTVLLKLD
ncbi:MAG: hypothetical protein WC787_03865 [Patescibacteria group bacterium]|jgi:hypothetical protein